MATGTRLVRGITWNHSRGLVPLVATSQRFAETHPGVEVVWEKRSLQDFADQDLRSLAERYDLIVMDHPWVGEASGGGILLALKELLPGSYLDELSRSSVGRSHESYLWNGSQLALAIDAATPVASFRPELLRRAGEAVPESWDEVVELARRGLVALPLLPIDALMAFTMMCSSLGCDAFRDEHWSLTEEVGLAAFELLGRLAGLVSPECFGWNPIAVYEALASREDLAYCPCAYGYSNYSRRGYARHELVFCDTVSLPGRGRLRTTLGGTGLAVSSACRDVDAALEYLRFAAGVECQSTLYLDNGGQPAVRSAWLDEAANRATRGYFSATLPALERAWLRPRYPGYLEFQDRAGTIVAEQLRSGGDAADALRRLRELADETGEGPSQTRKQQTRKDSRK